MKKLIAFVIGLVFMITIVSCDWTSGGGVEAWNDRYNWVNFSGVYRGYNGGVLVTDFSTTPGAAPTTNSTSEQIATGNGGSEYNGVLSHVSIVKGSLTITGGGYTWTDNGGGSLSSTVLGLSGSIDYGTGAWSIDGGGLTIDSGEAIRANYQYTVSGTSGSGSAGSGSSGVTIYSFVVHHEGNKLSITDNNGSIYRGSLGSVRSTGGVDQDNNETTPDLGDSVVAQFTASGTSAANKNVNMAGTFQGVIGGTAGDRTYLLSDRRMLGTWIESQGKTGDINGQASPVTIVVTSSSSETSSGNSTN